MFGLGAGEIFFVLLIALIVFGPDKIPEVARWLGKTSADLRKMSDSVRREFYNGIYVPPPESTPNESRSTPNLVTKESSSKDLNNTDSPSKDPDPKEPNSKDSDLKNNTEHNQI